MPTTAAQPVHVLVPQQRRGALTCPRCNGRLLHDGPNLLCVLCGYEYGIAQFLAQRSYARTHREGRPLPRVA